MEPLESRSLLSALSPAQMRRAYGLDAIQFSSGGQAVPADGSGQSVGIVVAYHNPFLAQELHTFSERYGLPEARLTQINLAGNMTDDGWAEEEAMDAQWVHAMAPGAGLVVVEARSASVTDLMAAVDVARRASGVSVVTMSWGGSEFRGQTSYETRFTTPAGHTGVTFVAASGDSGAASGPQWPAASSRVVGVGGTTLRVDAAGNTTSETAWSGSGGGISRVAAEPRYQRAIQRTGRRTSPDVSMNADPATGARVFTISPSMGRAAWITVGGTSLSAQLFGGLMAVVNQGRALRGLSTLHGASQTLPALYAMAPADYRDVTSGSNGYRALRGYDLTSGLGTPRASLVNDLVGITTFKNLWPGQTRTSRRTLTARMLTRRAMRPNSLEAGAEAAAASTPNPKSAAAAPAALGASEARPGPRRVAAAADTNRDRLARPLRMSWIRPPVRDQLPRGGIRRPS